jgi:hypothetical protein
MKALKIKWLACDNCKPDEAGHVVVQTAEGVRIISTLATKLNVRTATQRVLSTLMAKMPGSNGAMLNQRGRGQGANHE